jgi:hypothetical protein
MSGCTPGARTSWTARTTTATRLVGGGWLAVNGRAGFVSPALSILVLCVAVSTAAAQNVREHTRLDPRGTRVSQSQAETLTLTLGTAEVRLLQTWVRIAGTIDKTGKILAGSVSGPDAALVKVGQRVRAFPPSSKSSMYQAYVTRATPNPSGAAIEATLAASGRANTTLYVLEIVVEQGPFLVVPNEAIIEEGDTHIVYVQQGGEYVPKEVRTGIQGELYTQVLGGLEPNAQVVTFGSFFIDAEHKLKGTDQ